MKKILVVAVVLTVVAMSTFAIRKDPVYREARKMGALARMQIHVVDDLGRDVPDAKVNVFMGMNFRPKGHYLKGVTDTNGIFVAEGKTCGDEVAIDVAKSGYYSSAKKMCFAKIGAERSVKNGKWQPYDGIEKITLRRIVQPTNLIVFNKLTDVPKTNTWLGFDMEKMDFVRPIGVGDIVDFEVKVEWDGLPAWKSKSCSAEIRFCGTETGGCYAKIVPESSFPYIYAAQPDASYAEKQVRMIDRNGDPHATRIPFAHDSVLVTRTRCIIDENGKITEANYGCIRRFEIGPSRRGVALLRLSYVFNPTPNDTNLEPKR